MCELSSYDLPSSHDINVFIFCTGWWFGVTQKYLWSNQNSCNMIYININPVKDRQGNVLGLSWCKVCIQVVFARAEFLIRPDSFQTIRDVLGILIFWPAYLYKKIHS